MKKIKNDSEEVKPEGAADDSDDSKIKEVIKRLSGLDPDELPGLLSDFIDHREKEKRKKEKAVPGRVVKDLSDRSNEPEEAGKYIVLSCVNEDEKQYLPDEDYTGRWAKRFLRNGQIKRRD